MKREKQKALAREREMNGHLRLIDSFSLSLVGYESTLIRRSIGVGDDSHSMLTVSQIFTNIFLSFRINHCSKTLQGEREREREREETKRKV